MENISPIILTIVIALIVLAAGVAAYFTVLSPLFGGPTFTQFFTVTDPTVNQSCPLAYRPNPNSVRVEQYNGITWNNVSSTHFNVNGKIVTVLVTGLEG